MVEVEVKVRATDAADAHERAVTLGFHPVGARTERDTYFAHPARDFGRTDEALRVRIARDGRGEIRYLTYKGPREGAEGKVRDEIELECQAGMDQVLARLGFRPVAVVQKHRRTLRRNGLTCCIDEVEGLGPFVEIECSGTDELHEAFQLAQQIAQGEVEPRTYLELQLEARGPAAQAT